MSLPSRNYNVGNCKLRAEVLAIQERRQWLEGTLDPFLIWTNLSYLHSARRLNSRQACWSLFLSRDDYTLSYRHGYRNEKPDQVQSQVLEWGP